jgi:hypothetical protein
MNATSFDIGCQLNWELEEVFAFVQVKGDEHEPTLGQIHLKENMEFVVSMLNQKINSNVIMETRYSNHHCKVQPLG